MGWAGKIISWETLKTQSSKKVRVNFQEKFFKTKKNMLKGSQRKSNFT